MDGVKVRDDSVPADLLEAMMIRNMVIHTDAPTLDGKIDQNIWPVGDEYKSEFQRWKSLYLKGQEYFEQGYRYDSGSREMFGIPHNIPDKALTWALVSAGHIATSEAYRLIWVYKKKDA